MENLFKDIRSYHQKRLRKGRVKFHPPPSPPTHIFRLYLSTRSTRSDCLGIWKAKYLYKQKNIVWHIQSYMYRANIVLNKRRSLWVVEKQSYVMVIQNKQCYKTNGNRTNRYRTVVVGSQRQFYALNICMFYHQIYFLRHMLFITA